MNFFLDRSRKSWRAQFAELRAQHGALQPEGEFYAENALRGSWTMRSEQGRVNVWLSLAPTSPPQIQDLEIESVLTPSPVLVKAAAQLLRCVARPSRARLAKLVAPLANLVELWHHVRLANILCGECTLGKVVACDGATAATWQLDGGKQRANLVLTLDGPTGKIASAVLQPIWGQNA